jgi:peptidoglycan biosynthesis protein MviN/MurJ (putative lipid II flippase)
VTAVTQVSSALIGAVLAVFIVLKFGKNAETDALFAAYGVYGFIVLVANSTRVTVVARLVAAPSLFQAVDRFLIASLAILVAAAVPFLVLGGQIADLLTGDLGASAHDTARSALVFFWIAAAGQLFAGLFAAALAVRDEFVVPGLVYMAGGLVPVLSLVVLGDRFGIDSVTAGIAVGSFVTAGAMAVRFFLLGYRPRWASAVTSGGMIAAGAVVIAGSVGYLVSQLSYVITLGFAARLGEGSVTLFSYAFFAASLIIGASSGAITLVLAAPLSAAWDRRPAWLEPHMVEIFRGGLAFVAPAFAVMALAGTDLVDLVLGASLTDSDIETLVTTFLCLSGMVVCSLAAPVPTLAAFAAGRYGWLAAISTIGVGLHLGLSALALRSEHLELLGVASSASTLFALTCLLVLVWGRRTGVAVTLLARELGTVLVLTAATFGPPGLLAAWIGGTWVRALATVVGLALYVLALRRLLPESWKIARRAFGPLTQGRTKRKSPSA